MNRFFGKMFSKSSGPKESTIPFWSKQTNSQAIRAVLPIFLSDIELKELMKALRAYFGEELESIKCTVTVERAYKNAGILFTIKGASKAFDKIGIDPVFNCYFISGRKASLLSSFTADIIPILNSLEYRCMARFGMEDLVNKRFQHGKRSVVFEKGVYQI
jgi:hypothetical protein